MKKGAVFVMSSQHSKTDVILIGGGIMSATLGTLLKKVAPEKEIKVFEKLDASAQESSNAWNNAGTGHSALCEMNYTKEMPDGSLDISKVVSIPSCNSEIRLELISNPTTGYFVENNLAKGRPT